MNVELEEKLVSACRNGDKGAYGWLVKTYSSRVFSICVGMLSNREDAEDMAQQVMLKGLGRIKQLRNGARFGSWICTMTKNMCIDFLRKKKREKEAVHEQVQNKETSLREYGELQAALSELPEHYRLALLLFYFDGRSVKNIAETFDISKSAAQTRLSRARKRLREILESKGDI